MARDCGWESGAGESLFSEYQKWPVSSICGGKKSLSGGLFPSAGVLVHPRGIFYFSLLLKH